MNFSWASDIHLNFISEQSRFYFYDIFKDYPSDNILITGDIADAEYTYSYLAELALHLKDTSKTVYFVLGNHDYYHGSVPDYRNEMKALCKRYSNMVYLTHTPGIDLGDGFTLVVVDGWADARNGNYEDSPVVLNDSRYIKEISPWKNEMERMANKMNKRKVRETIRLNMQKLADEDAYILESQIDKVLSNDVKPHTIIIATHVPPVKSYIFEDKPCTDDYLPFFTSKVLNDLLIKKAAENPNVDFFSFSGHTHQDTRFIETQNLECYIAKAEYMYPKIQDIKINSFKNKMIRPVEKIEFNNGKGWK